MQGLRIVCDQELSMILAPIQQTLDNCWWYLGGAGVQFPLHAQNATAAELEQQTSDYSRFLDDRSGYRVGKPGWFSRYINYVDTSWELFFACEGSSSVCPRVPLDWLDTFLSKGQVSWFGDVGEWSLPEAVVLVCRNVDDAYWDLFFRDHLSYTLIEQHMQTVSNAACTPIKDFPLDH